MSLEIVASVWKELKPFIRDTYDRREAAEALVTVLMETESAEDIQQEFKFEPIVKRCLAEFIEIDEDELNDVDEY